MSIILFDFILLIIFSYAIEYIIHMWYNTAEVIVVEFKDRFKQLRLEHNITLTELATAFKKTESACRAWELGRSKPDADTLTKLSEYFHVSTDYLLGISEYRDISEYEFYIETASSTFNQIEKLTPKLKTRLLSSIDTAIYNISRIDPEEEESKAYERLNSFISVFSRMIVTSLELHIGVNADDYIVFSRCYENALSILGSHREAMIKFAFLKRDGYREAEFRQMIYGEDKSE